jgi:hypothetical protein
MFGHASRGRLSRDGPWCKTEKGANDDPSLFCILGSGRCSKPTNCLAFARVRMNYDVDQVHLRME